MGLNRPEQSLLKTVSNGSAFGVSVIHRFGGVGLARNLQSMGLLEQVSNHPKWDTPRWALTRCGCNAGNLLIEVNNNPLLKDQIIKDYSQRTANCRRPNPKLGFWCTCYN